MTTFKQWLLTRNVTQSAKGEMVTALQHYEHPAFVLTMWQGEYEAPNGMTTKDHNKAMTRLVWEAERAGCNIEAEVARLNVTNTDDPKWWIEAVDQDAEWEALAPAVAPKGARVERVGSQKDRNALAKALGLSLPNTRQGVEYTYLAALKNLLAV